MIYSVQWQQKWHRHVQENPSTSILKIVVPSIGAKNVILGLPPYRQSKQKSTLFYIQSWYRKAPPLLHDSKNNIRCEALQFK